MNFLQVERVVSGSTEPQTCNAEWLCFENLYEKLNRPNTYDIGGTFQNNLSDYHFSYRNEIIGDIFLVHVFVLSCREKHFKIGFSDNNSIVDNKNGILYFSETLKEFDFIKGKDSFFNYATTYHFTVQDLDVLKDNKLYVPFKILKAGEVKIDSCLDKQVKMEHDFRALLKDPVGSDFVIESSDGLKFQVHQIVLSMQSEVFYAMLKENTAEKQNAYVKLVDVNSEDLANVLEFIYTGTIQDLSTCNCNNLILLADRYDLKDLFVLAQHALCEQLTPDNAIELLIVADMCNSYYVKETILKFIKDHPSVLKSGIWNEISNLELMRELCEFIHN